MMNSCGRVVFVVAVMTGCSSVSAPSGEPADDAMVSRRDRTIAARIERAAHARSLAPAVAAGPAVPLDGSWADALDVTATVISASLTGPAAAAQIRTDLGVIKPLRGTNFVLLSTGVAGAGLDGLITPEPGTDFAPVGTADGDAVTLELDLQVPANATRMSFQYNFLSTESPDFVGSIFNDTFSVRLIDPSGQRDVSLASVNSSQFFDVSDSRAKGTGFDLYADDPSGIDTVFGGALPDAGLTGFQVFTADVTGATTLQLLFTIQDNGDGILDSAVVLDALQFSSIEAVDPNPGLLAGGVLTTDNDALATGGRAVRGAVTDGAADVLLRVKLPGPGGVTFSIPDPSNGTLHAVDSATPVDTVVSRSVTTASGEYAFAVYRAPADFNRGGANQAADAAAIERSAQVLASYQGNDGSAFDAEVELQLKRPPVVLARGMWSDNFFWLPPPPAPGFDPQPDKFVTNDPRYAITFAARPYSCVDELRLQLPLGQTGISCPWTRIPPPDGTVECQTELDNTISGATTEALTNVRRLNLAASQVDVVAHGDMGVQTRRYIASPGYQNDVNRLITVNTPHAGTSAADAITAARGRTVGALTPEQYLCHARSLARDPIDVGDLDVLKTQDLTLTHTAVPAHAIIGTGGTGLTSAAFKARVGGTNSIFIDVKSLIGVVVGNGSPTGCKAFGASDHDLVTESASALGGIAATAQTAFVMTPTVLSPPADQLSDYFHSTRNVNVSQRIAALLDLPTAGPDFAEFPDAPRLTQNCPGQEAPPPGLARAARGSLLSDAAALRIVSPIGGTTVFAGDLLTVEVAADGGFVPTSVFAVMNNAVGLSETAPFTIQLQVPSEALGPTVLFALGTDANDDSVLSDAVILDVETRAKLQSVKIITQDPVLAGAARHRQLVVFGAFDDHVSRDITAAASGTLYFSSNPAVVAVSNAGVITSVGTGIATVIARNGTIQDSITVTVIANGAPVARAGSDISRVCVAAGAAVPVQLDGTQSFDPEADPLTFAWSEAGVALATGSSPVITLGAGEHEIALVVSDGTSSSADSVHVSIRGDTEPPTTVCPANPTVECQDHHGIAAFIVTAGDDCALVSASCAPASGASFALGTTPDTCTATDAAGHTSSCQFSVIVRDSVPPVVTTIGRPLLLWPPDHHYQTFKLSDCVTHVTDACDGNLDIDAIGRITRVTSDEPEHDGHHDRGHGSYGDRGRDHDDDGDDTCNDIVITGSSSVKLRAERDDDHHANGRVYTLFFDVPDASGNLGSGSCQIAVPREHHDAAVLDSCRLCEGTGCGSCPSHDVSCRR